MPSASLPPSVPLLAGLRSSTVFFLDIRPRAEFVQEQFLQQQQQLLQQQQQQQQQQVSVFNP